MGHRDFLSGCSVTGLPLPELVEYSPDRPCTRCTCRRAGRESVFSALVLLRLPERVPIAAGLRSLKAGAFVTRSAGRPSAARERLVSSSARRSK